MDTNRFPSFTMDINIYKHNISNTCLSKVKSDTLPETNIAPENAPSQKENSIPTIHFQGLAAMLVWGRVTLIAVFNPVEKTSMILDLGPIGSSFSSPNTESLHSVKLT